MILQGQTQKTIAAVWLDPSVDGVKSHNVDLGKYTMHFTLSSGAKKGWALVLKTDSSSFIATGDGVTATSTVDGQPDKIAGLLQLESIALQNGRWNPTLLLTHNQQYDIKSYAAANQQGTFVSLSNAEVQRGSFFTM